MEAKILNSKGEPIVLNSFEKRVAEVNQKQMNALGYEVNITTLTQIVKKISEQKFFEIRPSEYLPIRVGEGAWSSNLVTYRSFNVADAFETGIINTGGQNDRLASADAGVDSVSIAVFNWAKSITWAIPDLELAARSGNWDLVSAKEKSRKKNWDLGVQKIAFLGSQGDNAAGGACQGLLNIGGVNTNTTVITQAISSMSPTQLQTFSNLVVEAYRSNNNRTAFPSHFIVPESDYNGMAAQTSPTFPMKSILQLLEEMFQTITRNKNFKILPLAYGDKLYSGFSVQKYVLLNYDDESVRMDIPVDYTNTIANSLNSFQYQNVGYGQFTGVQAYRPLEMLYFQF